MTQFEIEKTEKVEFGTQIEIEKYEKIKFILFGYRAQMKRNIDVLNELKNNLFIEKKLKNITLLKILRAFN